MKNKFYFYLGGFTELLYDIHYKGNQFNVSFDKGSRRLKFYVDSPSKSNWDRFWMFLDDINIWEWEKEYVDKNVLDGTQWEIKFLNSTKKIHSYGSNLYPNKKVFNNLIKEVEILFDLKKLKKQID